MERSEAMLVRRSAPEDGLISRRQAPDVNAGAPATWDDETRSVEVIAATETKSRVFDPERWEVIDEVLLMSGAQLPRDGRIPLTVEHERHAAAVIGSFGDMRVEGRKLVGRVYFSSAPDADGYATKVREGHLTRFSIVYPADSRKSVYIAEGEESTIEGKTYKGPLVVTKQWTPKSLGLVLYGADPKAKARAESKPNRQETDDMNEKLRKMLERKGLDPNATEDEAWAFLETLERKETAAAPPAKPDAGDGDGKNKARKDPEVDVDKVRAEAVGAERERIIEIDAMCKRFEMPGEFADELVRGGVGVDEARKRVMEELARKADGGGDGFRKPVTIEKDAADKFRAAAQDALILRAGMSLEAPAAGADELLGHSLREMAREALRVANRRTGGNPMEMVGRALLSSNLPHILANVANKSLFTGWDTAEETWMTWCGTGQVSDFKTHYSPRISEADDLDEIPDGGKYKYGKRTEEQETYSIATYGKIFAVTRQTIINDDLNALTAIPRQHGEAAARKVGDVVYAVLTANAAMGDGVALFASAHNNFVAGGSGGAPGVSTIAAGIKAMKTQKDLRNLRRLNIRPRFFIAPAALEGTAEVFFRTDRFDDSNAAATRVNPYAGNYFTRVYEPRLDDDDEAKWYLAAAKGKTVTVFFLDGVRRPYLETQSGWTVDGTEYKVRIDCGAKAMDWRGLYCNDGN